MVTEFLCYVVLVCHTKFEHWWDARKHLQVSMTERFQRPISKCQ